MRPIVAYADERCIRNTALKFSVATKEIEKGIDNAGRFHFQSQKRQ
jgi:hypothetical protein